MRDIWICVQTDAAGRQAIATIQDTEGRHVAADYDLDRLKAVAEAVRFETGLAITIHRLGEPVTALPALERSPTGSEPSWLFEPSRSS